MGGDLYVSWTMFQKNAKFVAGMEDWVAYTLTVV